MGSDFMKIFKDSNSSNGTSGLDFVLDQINSKIQEQKGTTGSKQSSSESRTAKPKKKSQKSKKNQQSKTADSKNKADEMQDKRAASNEVIMRHHGENNFQSQNKSMLDDLELEFSADNIVQGFIMSEILNKPLSKRRHRRNW